MNVSMKGSSISRQQLLQQYYKSPESAPLKIPALVNPAAAKDYRFETEITRYSSSTAEGLVDEAAHDAVMVKNGSGFAITKGCVALCAGFAAFGYSATFPPLILFGLACFYFGMTWIRQGTDKIRQSCYDTRFAADVAHYASQVADGGDEGR